MHLNISFLQGVGYSVSVIYYIFQAYFWIKNKVKGRPS